MMDAGTPAEYEMPPWPGARPYDVVFYRSWGAKAQVNVYSQHLYDPRIFAQARKFTHCAVVGSELTAVEAYPRTVEGPFTREVHPAGVRFVPVVDLCCDSSERYRDFAVLRCPALDGESHELGAEAMAIGWSFLRHRYGLRRFAGLRSLRLPGEPLAEVGTEWLSCADIVQKILLASGRFALKRREVVGPVTLYSELLNRGWQDVTADYAPEGFAAKKQRYQMAAKPAMAALDIFAVRVAWVIGTLEEQARAQQYRLESVLNRTFAAAAAGAEFDEAIRLLDSMRSGFRDAPALSAQNLMNDLVSRRGLLK